MENTQLFIDIHSVANGLNAEEMPSEYEANISFQTNARNSERCLYALESVIAHSIIQSVDGATKEQYHDITNTLLERVHDSIDRMLAEKDNADVSSDAT